MITVLLSGDLAYQILIFLFIVAQNKPDFSEVLSNRIGVLFWRIDVPTPYGHGHGHGHGHVWLFVFYSFYLAVAVSIMTTVCPMPITERWLL